MSEDSTTIWLSTLTAGGHALILRVLAWVAWERSSMQVMDSHPAGLFSRLLLLLYCICLDLLLLFFCFFFLLLSSYASSSFMFFLGLTAIFGRRGRLSFWAGEVDCDFVAGGRLLFWQDFIPHCGDIGRLPFWQDFIPHCGDIARMCEGCSGGVFVICHWPNQGWESTYRLYL